MTQLYIEMESAEAFSLRAIGRVVAVCLLGLYLLASLACQQNESGQSSVQPSPSGPSQSSPSASPQEPAVSHDAKQLAHYQLTPDTLPQPNATGDAQNPPALIPQPSDARLYMPAGFAINTFAAGGFERARWMALAPNGDVFVADADSNKILILRDTNQDGVADERFTFAKGLNKPFGMAFGRDFFYVANTNSVVRFHYQPGQTKGDGPEKIIDLPGQGYREHWTRNLIFNREASKLYVTVGSASDVDVEPEPRAAILECNPDGTGLRIFASGMRNPIGLSFRPGTDALWAAVQERDHLGDDLPPDYVTEVKDGGFYGWPYAYAGPTEDPRHRGERPELVRKTIIPEVLIQAHSAVLGLVFYTGKMFPQEYQGDAFVAMHGSWNRARRTGYKIGRIHFSGDKPAGGYDDFVTGWALGEDQRQVWGRPVGLLLLTDGSMLVTDDGANKIWRISYRAP